MEYVAHLKERVKKLSSLRILPVDLHTVASECGVVTVERREMIPEAVMAPEGDGFRIYLRSNFVNRPGANVRERFSLAHEIAHTLFYELRDGVMKSIRGAPTGERLEAACHRGAGLVLVPDELLQLELGSSPRDAAALIKLARTFEVSLEVIMRRLDEASEYETDYAPALAIRNSDGELVLEYAVYPPWLRAILSRPTRGMSFAKWFGPATPGDESHGLVREVPQGRLTARRLVVSDCRELHELRLIV